MADTPQQGYEVKMCVDSATPIDASSVGIEFVSCTLKKTSTHAQSQGIRGTRSRFSGRRREVQKAVSGNLTLNPGATEIDWFIQRILGGTTAGGVTALAEAIPEFVLCRSFPTTGLMHTFTGLRVNRWTLTANAGQPLTWSMDLEGEDETEAASSGYPSLTLPTDNMFICSDVTLTLASATRKFASLTLTLDNMLDTGRYLNSLTRSEIVPQDRSVTIQLSAPYTDDNEDLYDMAVAGAAGSLVIDDGTTTYTLSFGNLSAPAEGPEVSGRSEIMLPLNLVSEFDGTNREILCTKT